MRSAIILSEGDKKNKLGAIYGPSLLIQMEHEIHLQTKKALSAAANQTQQPNNTSNNTANSSNSTINSTTTATSSVLDSIKDMSLVTPSELRLAIDEQFKYSDILQEGSNWDRWLSNSNSAAASLTSSNPTTDSFLELGGKDVDQGQLILQRDAIADASTLKKIRKNKTNIWDPNKYSNLALVGKNGKVDTVFALSI